MKLFLLFLRHQGEQSVFRIGTIVATLLLATLILLASLSVGQGWALQNQKNQLASELSMASDADEAVQNSVYTSRYTSEFNGKSIEEIALYTADTPRDLPAGLSVLPPANEVWVTPALKQLIEDHPVVAERYVGYEVKTQFPHELAPAASSLFSLRAIPTEIVADQASDLSKTSARQLWGRYEYHMTQHSTLEKLMGAVALMMGVIIITPILLLVVEVFRIGIVQREKRYGTLSLLGASPRQIRTLLIADALPLSLLGVGLGLFVFWLIGVSALSQVSIGGVQLWSQDLQLSWVVYAFVGVGLMACSVLASLWSVRSVAISPLAVARTSNDVIAPRIWSILPLVIGIGGLVAFYVFGAEWYEKNTEAGGMVLATLLLLVLVGIIWGGAYITHLVARLMVGVSRGAAGTLAAYRLQSVPRKTFHSVSGVVIALFVGTLLMTFLATFEQMAHDEYAQWSTDAAADSDLYPLYTPRDVSVALAKGSVPDEFKELASTLQSRGLTSDSYIQEGVYAADGSYTGAYYDSCEQFTERTGRTCSGEDSVDEPFAVKAEWVGMPAGFALQFAPIGVEAQVTVLPDSYVFVAAGQQTREQVINAAYTATSVRYAATYNPLYVSYEPYTDYEAELAKAVSAYGAVIMAPIIVTLVVGGLNVFVAVAGSVFMRKRTFARLHALGAGFSTLARTLLIEVLLPLVALTIFVVGVALVSMYLLLASMAAPLEEAVPFALPGWVFWVGIASAVVCTAIVALFAIPILARVINLDQMRAE